MLIRIHSETTCQFYDVPRRIRWRSWLTLSPVLSTTPDSIETWLIERLREHWKFACDVIGSDRCMNTTHVNTNAQAGTRRSSSKRSSADRSVLVCDLSDAQAEVSEAIEKAGWKVDTANSTAAAEKNLYNTEYHVGVAIFTDLAQLQGLEDLLTRHHLHWVAVTESELVGDESVAALISDHCHDYHTLPCDHQQLVATLGHAYGMSVLRPRPAMQDIMADEDTKMVGQSDSMLSLFATIKKSARVDAPVMITGETGTGKELVGRAVHNQSPRSDGRFVTVSCATIPESQISKVLFGTESEAGKLEEANGGSLFLDSITDLPATQQMLLLRFMQSGQLEDHKGGQRNVDVRIITSCHNNIDDAVKNGTFREDLYYRLNILHIEIPPLRDRIGDVDSLAQFFFSKFSSESPGRIKGFSQQAKIAMHQHHWPGNVRELLNRVRQSLVMCESSLVQASDLGLGAQGAADGDSDTPTNLDEVRAKAEGEFIRKALERNYNNVTETAGQLGVSRVTLYRLMKKYGVNIAGSGRRNAATSK